MGNRGLDGFNSAVSQNLMGKLIDAPWNTVSTVVNAADVFGRKWILASCATRGHAMTQVLRNLFFREGRYLKRVRDPLAQGLNSGCL